MPQIVADEAAEHALGVRSQRASLEKVRTIVEAEFGLAAFRNETRSIEN